MTRIIISILLILISLNDNKNMHQNNYGLLWKIRTNDIDNAWKLFMELILIFLIY